MTGPTTTECPRCGSTAQGKFCANCGQSLGPASCVRCQAMLSPGAKFCHRCGTATTAVAGSGGRTERTAWIVAAVLALGLIGMVAWRVLAGVSMPARPDTGLAGGGTPGLSAGPGIPVGQAPDISKMTPSERFDRLNDKVMQAAQQGDTSTVINFTPMAIGAYAQLPTPDIDDRYHAAILHAQIGDFAPALALADTIAKLAPNDLFVPLIQGTVADFQGSAAGRIAAFKAFQRNYAAEIQKPRPEYQQHRALLEDFKRQADSAGVR